MLKQFRTQMYAKDLIMYQLAILRMHALTSKVQERANYSEISYI